MDEPSLLITATRTGGFAGLRRDWSVMATAPGDAETTANLGTDRGDLFRAAGEHPLKERRLLGNLRLHQ